MHVVLGDAELVRCRASHPRASRQPWLWMAPWILDTMPDCQNRYLLSDEGSGDRFARHAVGRLLARDRGCCRDDFSSLALIEPVR